MNTKAELNGLSIEKLCELYRNGMHMDEITIILLERFNYYIKSTAKDMIDKSQNYCGEFDDLVSVGQISLLEFLRKINDTKSRCIMSAGIYSNITRAMQKEINNNIKFSQESLNMHKEDSNLSFVTGNDIMSPEKNIELVMLREYIEILLEHDLKERERQVIVLRFGLEDGYNRSLTEIGKEFNVGSERIRQIEGKGLRKLRKKMYKYFPNDVNLKSNVYKTNFGVNNCEEITIIDHENHILFIPYGKISIYGYDTKIKESDMYTILRKFLINYGIKILSSNVYGMYIQYPSSFHFSERKRALYKNYTDVYQEKQPLLHAENEIIYLYPKLTCAYKIDSEDVIGVIIHKDRELFETRPYYVPDKNDIKSSSALDYIITSELCEYLYDLLEFDNNKNHLSADDALKLLLF